MDGRFLEAFTLLPRQREVCGRATKPLCLRHRIILCAIGSPFFDGYIKAGPKDVLIFSKIISSYDMAEMMTDNPTEHDIEWGKKMASDVELFEKQVKEAFLCIEDQSKWPVFWKKKSSNTKGLPWVLAVICNLVKNGVPVEDAWTMPESQAIWMNAGFAIASGADIDIVSDEDLKMQEFIQKMEVDVDKVDFEKDEEVENVI